MLSVHVAQQQQACSSASYGVHRSINRPANNIRPCDVVAEQCVGSRWPWGTLLIGWNASVKFTLALKVQPAWTLPTFAPVYVRIRQLTLDHVCARSINSYAELHWTPPLASVNGRQRTQEVEIQLKMYDGNPNTIAWYPLSEYRPRDVTLALPSVPASKVTWSVWINKKNNNE